MPASLLAAGDTVPPSNPELGNEALFAAIGLGPILEGKPTLHKYQLRAAADLSKELRRRILRFIASDSFAPAAEVPDFDYATTLKTVSAGELDDKQAAALFKAVPDRELAMELGVQVVRMLTWANPLLPRDTRPAVIGTRPADPDPSSTADFRRVWQVALDPMSVLDDLEDGSLADDQVAALALLYPAIYMELRQAIADGLAVMEGRRKSWEPAPQKATLLQMLRQEQQIDPELAAMVQQMYAGQPEQAPAGNARARRAPNSGASPDDAITPGQKAAGG